MCMKDFYLAQVSEYNALIPKESTDLYRAIQSAEREKKDYGFSDTQVVYFEDLCGKEVAVMQTYYTNENLPSYQVFLEGEKAHNNLPEVLFKVLTTINHKETK